MNSAFAILCCIGLIMLAYYSIRFTELSIRNTELQQRIDKAIEYIKSFEYYIPEDNLPNLLKILKGSDKE